MKIHFWICILLILFTFQLEGQKSSRIIVDIPTGQKPWNTLDWNNDQENFQFAIVTDRTGGHRPGVFLDGIKKINLLQPEFVMSVGDLIEGYTRDTSKLNDEWNEFNGFIDHLDVPFFYVPGNHDITNEVMEDKWEELFGVTYYHFVYKDVLFLCLNSEDNYRGAGRGTIDDEQYEFIEKVLNENKDVKWTMVFLHQPLWVQEDSKRWEEVTELLSTRPHNVFAGHYHRYWKSERNNGKYIALATTGGGSRLRGAAYGEFDHVVWVTMTKEGPMIANLLLDGIWDENVVTEEVVDLVRNQPFPAFIQPIYIENGKKDNGSSHIKITNESDYLMKVKMEGLIHKSVHYTLNETEIMVDPNDVKVVDFFISNDKNVDITSIEPIKIKTEISYDYGERPDIVFNDILLYHPILKNVVEKSQTNIEVDGDLSEWSEDWIEINENNYTGKPFDYKGKEDCSLLFSTLYDDKYFYLAVDINDDEIFSNEEGSHWRQDALQVAIDARPKHLSERNIGIGRNTDWLSYLLTFKSKDAIYNTKVHPEGIKYAISKHDKGASIEIAFPLEYLNSMQKKPWEYLRLGLGYLDYDKGGKSNTVHYWFPAWNSKETIHGSGMFFKE